MTPLARVRVVTLAACLAAWLLSFLAVPALHLANHREDHVHLPGGGIIFAPQGALSFVPQQARGELPVIHRGGVPFAPTALFQDGGMAHFSLSIVAAVVALIVGAGILVLAREVRPPELRGWIRPCPSHIFARGPPA